MKLSNRRTDRGTRMELNMTPMIDMVFLLLIFFFTTSFAADRASCTKSARGSWRHKRS